LDETFEAPRAQREQHRGASELEESNETDNRRKATVWRGNHEEAPKEDANHQRHWEPGHDAPVSQEALEVGWRGNAEKTDPCDSETG